MSGGYFDYNQYKIQEIIDRVEQLIYEMENNEDEYNKYEGKKDEFILVYKEALDTLIFAQMFTQRIDWFESGDDGVDSFFERLMDESKKIISERDGDDKA